jgi:hypothetical protein
MHARDRGDRALAFALSHEDHDAMAIVELWGLPVLGWEAVAPGTLKLLCAAEGVLIPPFDTVEDLVDRWEHHLTTAPGSQA